MHVLFYEEAIWRRGTEMYKSLLDDGNKMAIEMLDLLFMAESGDKSPYCSKYKS